MKTIIKSIKANLLLTFSVIIVGCLLSLGLSLTAPNKVYVECVKVNTPTICDILHKE